jgi:hypothetical protein
MSSFTPIRRSRWKPKAKRDRISMPWRPPKIRLGAAGMRELRTFVFDRWNAQCENSIDGQRCDTRIYWGSFHLAHMEGRGRGGLGCTRERAGCLPELSRRRHPSPKKT